MESYLTDLMTALVVIMNGVPQGLLALSFGFAAFPTAIAFLIGAAGSTAFNSVATISFQAETITVAAKMGENMKERLSLVFWGAAFLLVPSILGLNETIVSLVGPVIVNSMMAGVGIMLAYVSISMYEGEKISGAVAMVSALAVWFLTLDLVKTILISVIASTIVYNFLKRTGRIAAEDISHNEDREKLTTGNIYWKVWEHPRVLVGALALSCLNIGANISFGKITGSIAGANTNKDHLAIYSSLADMASSFFGGGPVESIISGTATAPHPVLSSVMMMLIMAAILLLKLLPVIGRYVHSSSNAGFLFVLGVFVTFTSNIQGAIAAAPAANGPFGFSPWGMVIGATTIISARWNPFYGLLAGVAIKLVFGL